MEEALGLLAWLLIDQVLVRTGGLVVRVISLGRWRGESVARDESRVHAPAGALSFERDGRRVVTVTGMLFLGVAFYVGLLAALLWVAGR